MDIAAASTALSQASVSNQIDVAVASKTLASEKSQGQALVAMIANAGVSDPSGSRGGQIDVYG